MKYLIVGLGNIGSEYENTRHNIGFKILDALAKASNIFFEANRLADTATLKFKGRTFILVKPSTFMNLSGKAVNYYLQQEKIKQETKRTSPRTLGNRRQTRQRKTERDLSAPEVLIFKITLFWVNSP